MTHIEPIPARIDALAEATQRLQAAVHAAGPEAIARPCLLPDWTIGHLLTHISGNAEANRNLLHWADSGIPTPMYPSQEARNEAIEAGAHREPEAILADFDSTIEILAKAIADLPPENWQTLVNTGRAGDVEATIVLDQRLAEVEVHHADLGVDDGFQLLTDDAAQRLLGALVRSYARTRGVQPLILDPVDSDPITIGDAAGAATVAGTAPALCAWLAGRSDGADLRCDGPLPDLPSW